jgi:uncharacterized protein (DUF433 family)
MTFARITVDPSQMDGVPCIRGLRTPVATVVGMIADGMTEAEIVRAYPDLEPDDLREALRYAAEAVRERELPLVKTAWGSSSTTRGHRTLQTACAARDTMPCMCANTAWRDLAIWDERRSVCLTE